MKAHQTSAEHRAGNAAASPADAAHSRMPQQDTSGIAQQIAESPRMQTQRRNIERSMGPVAQREVGPSAEPEAGTAAAHEGPTETKTDSAQPASPDEASLRKKLLAKAWLESQLAQGVANEEALLALLAQAKAEFGLADVAVDTRDPGAPRIGFKASPFLWAEYLPNKLIGNTVSDWLLWGFYGTVSEADRWLRGKKPQAGDATQVQWGPVTGRGFASYMLADPLTKLGPDGAAPNDSTATWEVLKKRRQKASGASTYYVLGHLLNDNVHGPGVMKNLTPLSQRTNNHSPIGHLKAIENDVKADVKGAALRYEVVPSYGRNPFKWPRYLVNAVNFVSEIGDVLAAEDHVPVGLTAAYWRYGAGGQRELQKKVWIPQMQVGSDLASNEYHIELDDGKMLTLSEPGTVWRAIDGLFMSAVAAALSLSVMQAHQLLSAYASGLGLTAVEVVAAHQFELAAVIGLLSGYASSGRNPWPKDPTNKQD